MGTLRTNLKQRGVFFSHVILLVAFLIISAGSLYSQPTVNGRFYGDSDYPTYYTEYASSLTGRGTIYTYQNGVDLYIATVVDAVGTNDNVFAGNSANDVAYCQSVGWSGNHTAKDLLLSDHLEITFTTNCGGTVNSYSWWQDLCYAVDSDGKPTNSNSISNPHDPEYTWVSDVDGHDGQVITSTPAVLTSSSSTAWNFNLAQTTWDMTEGGTRTDHDTWKSPFSDPASLVSPNHLGYPQFDPVTTWEWPLVYEMHIQLDNASCSYTIELLAHNSPPKSGSNDIPIPEYDYGDAPDPDYPTLIENDGARHLLIPDGPYLGTVAQGADGVDTDARGQEDPAAEGDDNDGINDEQGVHFPSIMRAGETVTLTVDVVTTGTVYLNAWIDFNGDGSWDAGEQIAIDFEIPATGSYTIDVPIPYDAVYNQTTFARFRLSSDSGLGVTGAASDGEVEDHAVSFEEPIVIELTNFTASIVNDGVNICWNVVYEVNHAGYNIYRSNSAEGDFERVNETMIKAKANGSTNIYYEYMDTDVSEGPYFYKLEDIDLNGQSTWHGPIQTSVVSDVESAIELPTEFDLAQNYPNPFNPVTTIGYSLPESSNMILNVYNVQGKLIKTLVSGLQPAGFHSVTWDGADNVGEPVPSGIYLYRMTAGEFNKVGRMTLLK